TITLNRPEVFNAMDSALMSELRDACERAAADASVRAIALRGAGRGFCAGGDVPSFHREIDTMADTVHRFGRDMHFAMWALRRAAKPVVAVVHGAAAGAGFALMCATDLVIAADDTRFTLAYTAIGASPDGGSSYFLPRLVGYRRAMELVLLPDAFDAATALSLGLINRVVPAADLDAEAAAWLARLASGPTAAYGECKRLMNASFDTTMETQMERELDAFARCAAGPDFREGVAAFTQKRKPVFVGR
nr:enoyl-CoA hydratase-related protein [Burkholderiales bacterium]